MAYTATFREMTKSLKQAASTHCGGKLLMLHEGGYSPAYTPFCGVAVIEELVEAEERVEDPFAPIMAGLGMQELQPHQRDAIARSAALVERIG